MNSDLKTQKRLAARAIRRAETFFLSGHLRPDGDCLGSALALKLALEAAGKKAQVYSADPVPDRLKVLPGWKSVKVSRRPEGRFDAAIFLECSTPLRSGSEIDLKSQAGVVINIDSHLRTELYGDINLIEPEISSTAEQVYDLLRALGLKVSKDVATCLYVGLTTDTGRFQYSNTSPRALRMAAELLEAGVEATPLNELLFTTNPLAALKLLSRTLSGMRLHLGGRLAVLKVSQADLKACGAKMEHTEELVNYGLSTEGARASILFKEDRGSVKVSLRSKGTLDISRIALGFGGGGHRNAAGCTLQGGLASAERRVLSAAKAALG